MYGYTDDFVARASLRTLASRPPASGESFSDVVLRAEWPDTGLTAAELLARYEKEGPFLSEPALERIERGKAADATPADKWATG